MISIIIPVFNEGAIIQQTLQNLLLTDETVEIILVDGGSQDNTKELAKAMGVKAITLSPGNRAKQMNFGAKLAQGDILLFLHADTTLPKNFISIIQDTLGQPNTIAGAFELNIDAPQLSLRLVETLVNLRSRLFSLPYGDQAIFLKASVFQMSGGFPELPIMEDFVFVRRLNKQGKIAIAPQAVLTSSRRWQKLGVVKTTLVNQLMIIGYFLGVPIERLANFYRQVK